MSGIRANWHLDGLELPEGDPMQEIEQLKSEATVIRIARRSNGEIAAELSDLLKLEGEYAASGLACDLKWTTQGPLGPSDQRNPCYGCSYYTEDEERHARALLCSLGRRQNDLCDELEALAAGDRLDAELADAHERELAAVEELAAALL